MTVLNLLLLITLLFGVECKKKFKFGDEIPLYANHVGPHNNPQETYPYFNYPFCRSKELTTKFSSIGEALQGIHLVKTLYDVFFLEPITTAAECSLEIDSTTFKKFDFLIKHEYWYQYYLDDLPIWGIVGKKDEANEKTYIFTHKDLIIGYNKDNNIVQVDVLPGVLVELKEGEKIDFTYSVSWKEVNIPYGERFARYLDNDFFEHKIHWFSIMNSMLMLMFLVGLLVLVVVRAVKGDLSEDIGGMNDFTDESSWKKLGSEVFRPPKYVGLMSVFLGTGVQLLILIFIVIIFAILGSYYDDRGAVKTTLIIFYVLTSIISGFVSGSYYIQNLGKNWIRVLIFNSLFFPLICAGFFGGMNFFSVIYRSAQSIPFVTIVLLLLLHSFITIPLMFVGTILGRSFNSDPKHPLQPKLLKRPIPRKRWYNSNFIIMIAGGLLPFGCIFIELKYVLDAVFSFRIYYVYGFFLTVFCILLVVVVCVSIILTYYLLICEDYRYHWVSYGIGSSIGYYIFFYSLYFYMQTQMSGFFQFIYFVSYTGFISIVFSFVCGTISYWSARYFVRKIYEGTKVE